MRVRHDEKKARSKTERALLFLEVMATVFSALAAAAVLLRLDGAVYLVELALGWLGATAIFYTMYCRKEGRANSQKYMEKWVEETADKYGADAAARFAEIVLQNSNL